MWAKLTAIIGAIQAVASIIKTVNGWIEKYQDKKIDTHYENKQKRRKKLVQQINNEKAKEVPSDDILKDLHRKLRNIDSKQL